LVSRKVGTSTNPPGRFERTAPLFVNPAADTSSRSNVGGSRTQDSPVRRFRVTEKLHAIAREPAVEAGPVAGGAKAVGVGSGSLPLPKSAIAKKPAVIVTKSPVASEKPVGAKPAVVVAKPAVVKPAAIVAKPAPLVAKPAVAASRHARGSVEPAPRSPVPLPRVSHGRDGLPPAIPVAGASPVALPPAAAIPAVQVSLAAAIPAANVSPAIAPPAAVARTAPPAAVARSAPPRAPARTRAASVPWSPIEDAFFGAGEALEREPVADDSFDDLERVEPAHGGGSRGIFARLFGR
jgi:hypothetical protein